MEACSQLLMDEIASSSTKPYSFSIPTGDLLAVLINYGALKSKFSKEKNVSLPAGIQADLVNRFDGTFTSNHSFPYENLTKVLELLRFNLAAYPGIKILKCKKILSTASKNLMDL